MKDANLNMNDLKEVALVGDFTKTSMIQRMINEMFKGKTVRLHDNTAHFFASHGAALEAAIVQDIQGNEYKDLLQLDATSHSLGIRTNETDYTVIIPRNTSFPTHRARKLTTTKDHQTHFPIMIFEGDSMQNINENVYLGSFVLELPPMVKGQC